MEYLDSFTNSNYTLTDGRLLTSDDANTNNCVIETNLASDNDLSVGDTFTITTQLMMKQLFKTYNCRYL